MGKSKVFILFIVLCLLFVGCSKLKESAVNIDELNTEQGIFMSDVSLKEFYLNEKLKDPKYIYKEFEF